MNKQMPFIKTSDEEVANVFRQQGYPELEKEGSLFVFVNIGKFENGEFTKTPINFSRTLCL
jgi:hypothetical protein